MINHVHCKNATHTLAEVVIWWIANTFFQFIPCTDEGGVFWWNMNYRLDKIESRPAMIDVSHCFILRILGNINVNLNEISWIILRIGTLYVKILISMHGAWKIDFCFYLEKQGSNTPG